MLQGFPSTIPSNLGPGRLGMLSPGVPLGYRNDPTGQVRWPPMGFEGLPQLGYSQRFMTQLIPESAVRLREKTVNRFPQRRAPCSEEGRDRYIEDKLTDTISANITPCPRMLCPVYFYLLWLARGRLAAPHLR